MGPKDRIAWTVTIGLLVWGVLTIGGAIYRNKSLTEGGTEWFIAIGGAMVAMLVTYFTRNGDN